MDYARQCPSWSAQNMHLFTFRKANRWIKRNGRKKSNKNLHLLLGKYQGGVVMNSILHFDARSNILWDKLFINSPTEDIVKKLRYASRAIERIMSMKKYLPRTSKKIVAEKPTVSMCDKKSRSRLVRTNARRKCRQNRHHLLNKCQGGGVATSNILWLKLEKHSAWHNLFKNSPPEDIVKKLSDAADTMEETMGTKGYIHRTPEKVVVRKRMMKTISILPGERILKYMDISKSVRC